MRLIITADKVLIPREGYEHNPLRCAVLRCLLLTELGAAAQLQPAAAAASWARPPTPGVRLPRPCTRTRAVAHRHHHQTLAACSNHFVDVLEEQIAEWVRQQVAATQPMSIDGHGGMHGPHGGLHGDFEDDHSSA